jgi:uncharacterized protein YggU (UPF0235/DUF167 family)
VRPAPAGPASAATAEAGALRLRVRLTPRAAADALGRFERLADGSEVLRAQVRAVPEDGAANTALVALVAAAVGVAKSRVAVISGSTSRIKTLRIEGDPDAIAAALARTATARS